MEDINALNNRLQAISKTLEDFQATTLLQEEKVNNLSSIYIVKHYIYTLLFLYLSDTPMYKTTSWEWRPCKENSGKSSERG